MKAAKCRPLGREKALVVARQATEATDPRETALHDPPRGTENSASAALLALAS
jgi:hypothetical protein